VRQHGALYVVPVSVSDPGSLNPDPDHVFAESPLQDVAESGSNPYPDQDLDDKILNKYTFGNFFPIKNRILNPYK
jgi:hypothetical protein